MHRLLIVDDEAMIRRELSSSFPWTALGFELAGTASSGEQALERISEEPINAVLLDIRMPGMGGLEALRIIKKRFPDTEVVILSAYDDYSYVREGLKLGAFDYILKIDLITELEPVMARLQNRLSLHNSDADLVTGCLEGRYLNLPGWPCGRDDLIGCAPSDSSGLPGGSLIYGEFAFFPCPGKKPPPSPSRGGMSGPYHGSTGHRAMLYQALRAFEISRCDRDNPFPAYDSLEKRHDTDWYNREGEKLVKSMILGEREFPGRLDPFLEEVAADPGVIAPVAGKIGRRLYSDLLKSIEHDMGKDGEDRYNPPQPYLRVDDLVSYIRESLVSLFMENLDRRRSRLSGNIFKARGLVDRLYMTNLRIEEVARAVDMGSSNFKIRFKEQTGEPFTAYLQSVRIRHARELLERTEMRIYEISDRIGYSDEKYFRKVFRQKTGKTPREYREELSDNPPEL